MRAALVVVIAALWTTTAAAQPGAPAPPRGAPARGDAVEAAPTPAHPTTETEAVPEPPPDIELRPVTVLFRADAPGVRVHYLPDPVLDDGRDGGLRVRLASPSRYGLLCEAPCDVELPQSHFGLAFARGERFVRAPDPLGVDGPTGVRIDWQDRDAERLAGLLALVIGAPLALAAAALSIGLDLGTGGDGVAAGVGGGVGGVVAVAAVVIGVVLLVSEDGAEYSVTPLPADGGALFSEEWR